VTHYIGNIPVSSIQEVTISKGEETDEIDLIEEDTNIILSGFDEGEEMEIEFTLLKQTHPERIEAEEQRKDLKGLASNDVSDNYFSYNNSEYFLAVEEVSVPESSTLQKIREGTITAKALPFPKHFQNERRGNDKLDSGNVILSFDIDSDAFRGIEVLSDLSYQFIIDSDLKRLRGSDGEIDYTLLIESFVNQLSSTEGVISINEDVTGQSSVQTSKDGEIEYSFSFKRLNAQSFGRDFGRFFGTSEDANFLIIYVLRSVLADMNVQMDVIAEGFGARVTEGMLEITKDLDGDINSFYSSESGINYNLTFDDLLSDLKRSSVGCVQLSFYNDGDASINKFSHGDVYTSIVFNSEVNTELTSKGTIQYVLYSDGDIDKKSSALGILQNTMEVNGETFTLYSTSGSIDISTSIDGDPIRIRPLNSLIEYAIGVMADGDILVSDDGDVDYSFSLSGEVEIEYGPFGRYFGRSFGGSGS